MNKPNRPVSIEFDENYNLKINIEGIDRISVLSKANDMVEEFKKASEWIDDQNVPNEDRQKFADVYRNMMHSISFLKRFLECAGVTEEELKEHELPF